MFFLRLAKAAAVAQAVSQMTQPGALGAQAYDSDELGMNLDDSVLWGSEMWRCCPGRKPSLSLNPPRHRHCGSPERVGKQLENERSCDSCEKRLSIWCFFESCLSFSLLPQAWPAFFWCFFWRYLKFVCETAILGARISSNGHWLGARALRKENSDSDPSGSSHLWSMAVHGYQVVIFWLPLLVSVTGLSGLMLPQLRIWVRNSLGWMLSAKPLAPEPFMPDLGLQWASIPKFPSLPQRELEDIGDSSKHTGGRFTLEIGFIWNIYQGVEVYQTEWSYGGSCNGPTNTGIFSCPPRGGIVTMGMFVGCLEWANSLTASRDLSLKWVKSLSLNIFKLYLLQSTYKREPARLGYVSLKDESREFAPYLSACLSHSPTWPVACLLLGLSNSSLFCCAVSRYVEHIGSSHWSILILRVRAVFKNLMRRQLFAQCSNTVKSSGYLLDLCAS